MTLSLFECKIQLLEINNLSPEEREETETRHHAGRDHRFLPSCRGCRRAYRSADRQGPPAQGAPGSESGLRWAQLHRPLYFWLWDGLQGLLAQRPGYLRRKRHVSVSAELIVMRARNGCAAT